MIRIALRAVLAAVAIAAAWPAAAIDQSSLPTRFNIPWGNSAGSAYIRNIPQASQIGIQNCAASLTDGFPPLTFVPASQGGCPPFGQDFNGILKQATQWIQWQGAGGTVGYNSGFSSAIGGYPKGAVLQSAAHPTCYWISQVDSNASNPDSSGANWTSACPGGGIGATSGGSANAQTVTVTPFNLIVGAEITFVAGFSNTAQMTINVNGAGAGVVYRLSQLGATATVGGEVVSGQVTKMTWDGTHWQVTSAPRVRVGSSVDLFNGTTPTGLLAEDGSCVSQTTYADLFGVIGTAYGTCSAGNFALPDTRSTVSVGPDGGTNRLSAYGCLTVATKCGIGQQFLSRAQLPNITFSTSVTGTATFTGTANLTGTTEDMNNRGWEGINYGPTLSIPGGNGAPLLGNINANTNSTSNFSQGGGLSLTASGAISTSGTVNSTGLASTGGTGDSIPTVQPTIVILKAIQP
jgi:microcystin-dependent protein